MDPCVSLTSPEQRASMYSRNQVYALLRPRPLTSYLCAARLENRSILNKSLWSNYLNALKVACSVRVTTSIVGRRCQSARR